jgi:hypothetical protein
LKRASDKVLNFKLDKDKFEKFVIKFIELLQERIPSTTAENNFRDRARSLYDDAIEELIGNEHKNSCGISFFTIIMFGYPDDLDKLIFLLKGNNRSLILKPEYYKCDYIIPVFIHKIVLKHVEVIEKYKSLQNLNLIS